MSDNKQLPKWVTMHGSGRYQATVTRDKKRVYLGVFDTPEEAHAMAQAYRNEHPYPEVPLWRPRDA